MKSTAAAAVALLAGLLPAAAGAAETIHIERLDNGVTFAAEHRPGSGTFALQIAALGGSVEDPDDRPGLTAVLGRMLLRGTASLAASEQALRVERTGSSLEAGSGPESVSLWASGPAGAFEEVFDIAAEAALRPRLDAADLGKEIAIARQGLDSWLETPGSALWLAARPLLFGRHPLGRTPDPETFLAGVDIEAVRAAHVARFTGARLIVVLVGDVEPARALEQVRNAFGSVAAGTKAALPFDPPEPLKQGARAHARRRTSQPEILVALPTRGLAEEDLPAMSLLAHILGGFQERLSRQIREERGWAYWLRAVDVRHPGAGLYGIHTAVPKRRLEETEAIIRAELRRIATQPPSEEEVERARRHETTLAARNWQRSAARARMIALDLVHGREPIGYEELAARTAAVTPQKIRDLARRLLDGSPPGVVTLH